MESLSSLRLQGLRKQGDPIQRATERLLSGSLDRTVILWENSQPKITYEGHTSNVIALCMMTELIFVSGS